MLTTRPTSQLKVLILSILQVIIDKRSGLWLNLSYSEICGSSKWQESKINCRYLSSSWCTCKGLPTSALTLSVHRLGEFSSSLVSTYFSCTTNRSVESFDEEDYHSTVWSMRHIFIKLVRWTNYAKNSMSSTISPRHWEELLTNGLKGVLCQGN